MRTELVVRSPSSAFSAPAPGFSLIEVLVALVVLSVGLLTVAALQVKGLQFERNALHGTRATLLAADLVDRIRANPAGAEFYQIGVEEAVAAPKQDCADGDGPAVTDPCSPADMATWDLWEWRSALASDGSQGIPAGTGGVEFIPGTVSVHRITVRWREEGSDVTYEIDISNEQGP